MAHKVNYILIDDAYHVDIDLVEEIHNGKEA